MRFFKPILLALSVIALGACSSSAEDESTTSDDNAITTGVVADKNALFDGEMYFVRIRGWDGNRMSPASLANEATTEGAELFVYKAKPTSPEHCPDSDASTSTLVFKTKDFSLRTSGNFTNGTPKSSYKVSLEKKTDRLFGMTALNLKAMWNDPSQMREALAWKIFEKAGVAAPRHTYAKFCVNDKYYGLYSLIEQVDKSFLKDHFGNNDGNLFKAYWIENDIGPADLQYRKSGTDDSGKQYFKLGNADDRSYRLKAGSDAPANATYDDLATFIRVLNGVTTPGEGRAKFDTPAFKEQMERVFNVKGFLRWASVNMLLGAWDNYYGTPANYYVYNSGSAASPDTLMSKPYFTWIPWDYDNSFGSDFFNTKWHYNDIVDWEAGTRNYYQGRGTAHLPLLTNLLANKDYLKYYLDSIEYLVDNVFNEGTITGLIGSETSGLRKRVQTAAFLEADQPTSPAHTGRQFTNDEVFQNGLSHNDLTRGTFHLEGILHYVRMRHDNVKDQLTRLRQTYPRGSSGGRFPARPESIP